MLDRIQEAAALGLERALERQVAQEFATRRASGATKLPWIDGEFDPSAPPEVHAQQQRRVVRALIARRWFKAEAGTWAVLPLCKKERLALIALDEPRIMFAVDYSEMLQSRDWHLGGVTSFYDFVRGD
jgi:hypothetical protein